MTEQAQVGDTVRLTIVIEGTVVEGDNGWLHVHGWGLAGLGKTVEILYRATAPLPSEPGTWWLDVDDDVWRVNENGFLYCYSESRVVTPATYAPFRQLVLKEES